MTPEERKQLPVWAQVAERAGGSPNGVTRMDIARQFGIDKTTAQSHLERAVKKGALVKTYTWTDRSHRGWVYTTASAERLF